MNMTRILIDRILMTKASLKKHRGVVLALASLVVFITTYMLILPAITLDDSDAEKTPGVEIDNEVSIGFDADTPEKAESETATDSNVNDDGKSGADSKDTDKVQVDNGSDSDAVGKEPSDQLLRKKPK